MAETISCPNCKARVPAHKFCERCRQPLPAVTAPSAAPLAAGAAVTGAAAAMTRPPAWTLASEPASEPVAVELSPLPPLSPLGVVNERTEPAVAIDALCIQNDAWSSGFLRVRFYPGGGAEGCDNVTLVLQDQQTGQKYVLAENAWYNRMREFKLNLSRHAAGPIVFDVYLGYDRNRKRIRLEGDWSTVSITNSDARNTAEQLVVNITNNITTGHACDINNSTLVKDRLEEALRGGGDISQQLRDIVCGAARSYAYVDLFDENGILPLPSPQPAAARTDRLTLDLGTRRLQLFAARTVTFGRGRDCDVCWRHPRDGELAADDPERTPYRKLSRHQCFFEHRGEEVAIVDGGRDELRVVKPSSYGTYFNASRISGEQLMRIGEKEFGLLNFSDSSLGATVGLCSPRGVCANCTLADRDWCAGGSRPCLVLKRNDGVPEIAVAVWSCFRLEEADPSFAGVKVFRDSGAFAWRRGRRCGWLVPGETIDTELGPVKIIASERTNHE